MRAATFICWIITFILLLVGAPVFGQVSSTSTSTSKSGQSWVPHPVRDDQAVQVVQAAINAMGGAAAIGQAQSYVVQAQVQQSANATNPNGTVVWTVSGAQYRSDFTSAQGTLTISTGNGTPYRSTNGTVSSKPAYSVRPLFAPAVIGWVLLKEFQDTNYSLQYEGTGTVGSASVALVKTSSQATRLDARVTQQTWYFDKTTGLPLQVDYRLRDSKIWTRYLKSTLDFSGYRAVAGILYPFQIIRSVNDKQMSTLTVESVTPNPTVQSSFFDAPAGGVQ